MKRITAWEFLGMIAENPSVFENWYANISISRTFLPISPSQEKITKGMLPILAIVQNSKLPQAPSMDSFGFQTPVSKKSKTYKPHKQTNRATAPTLLVVKNLKSLPENITDS